MDVPTLYFEQSNKEVRARARDLLCYCILLKLRARARDILSCFLLKAGAKDFCATIFYKKREQERSNDPTEARVRTRARANAQNTRLFLFLSLGFASLFELYEFTIYKTQLD